MNYRYLTSAKAVLMSVLLFVFCLVASAESYTYQDSWGKQGLTLTSNTPNKVELNVSVNNFTLESVDINGEQMQEIAFDGFALFTNAGEPNIPGISRLVAIPQGATANLEIIDYRVEIIQNVNIAPSPVIPKENEDGLVFSKSSNVYSRNAFFPENISTLSEVKQLRGVDVVLLTFRHLLTTL
ncbi:MAG: C25 family peptidase propeptide domain-containing protein [Lentimicrobiaceae bacterium]|nr:C25 family peptidase propeptide domain-containing protein [Lentimicrobiaceae bacterium]